MKYERAMNVTPKPELEKLIDDEVKSGRSTDSNEFLNRAVYHYVLARDLGQEYSPEEMDRMIAEGLDDIEAGNTIDGEDAFRQLRANSAERRNIGCEEVRAGGARFARSQASQSSSSMCA